MERNPVALRQDPIIEATFEVRFQGSEAAGDLLPGMLFPKLHRHFGNLVPLPISQIPRAMRQQQPLLAYQPSTALAGEKTRLALGDRAASVSFVRPYPGWMAARPIIHEVLEALGQTGLVSTVERCSLKYVNVLTVGRDANDLGTLKVSLTLGSFEQRPSGKHIRVEIEHRGYIHVVQIITGAEVSQMGPTAPVLANVASGVVVDIDTVKVGPIEDPWSAIPNLLDDLHDAEKDVFFGILTRDAIDRMHPIYA